MNLFRNISERLKKDEKNSGKSIDRLLETAEKDYRSRQKCIDKTRDDIVRISDDTSKSIDHLENVLFYELSELRKEFSSRLNTMNFDLLAVSKDLKEREYTEVLIDAYSDLEELEESLLTRDDFPEEMADSVKIYTKSSKNNILAGLASQGIKIIHPSEGELFDRHMHIIENSESTENKIIEKTVLSGFSFDGKVIRKAYVIVKE